MRFYTKICKAKFVISLIVVIWIFILTLITINHTLSCVDKEGDLKKSCQFYNENGTWSKVFTDEYNKLFPDI